MIEFTGCFCVVITYSIPATGQVLPIAALLPFPAMHSRYVLRCLYWGSPCAKVSSGRNVLRFNCLNRSNTTHNLRISIFLGSPGTSSTEHHSAWVAKFQHRWEHFWALYIPALMLELLLGTSFLPQLPFWNEFANRLQCCDHLQEGSVLFVRRICSFRDLPIIRSTQFFILKYPVFYHRDRFGAKRLI